jgi:hypothetical protein
MCPLADTVITAEIESLPLSVAETAVAPEDTISRPPGATIVPLALPPLPICRNPPLPTLARTSSPPE